MTTVELPGVPVDESDHGEHAATVDGIELARIAFVLGCAAAVWFRVWEPWTRVSVIGCIGAVVGGWPIFAEAAENLRERRMTMELSMTIALLAALAIGEFFTALIITAFVLAAEILGGLTVGRGRRAIRELLDLLPASASVRRGGVAVDVPLSDVRIGDAVIIAPGSRIPVDGTVSGGTSFVDQAAITGESMPVEKAIGDVVYAGTINHSGALEVAAERLGADTSFGKIIEAVERAEHWRAPIQRTADRYAGYLVYFALACALITFLITRNARSTISVVIVAGACGIAAGTPLAVLGAIGRAAREGAIIKGGLYLESLWLVDLVAFDKTGTVTFGVPTVTAVRSMTGVSADTVLQSAAIAECRSEHPLAKAIVRRARELGGRVVEPDAFHYTPGRGVVARLNGEEIIAGNRALMDARGIRAQPEARVSNGEASEVVIARAGRVLGSIRVSDDVRPEAAKAVGALRRLAVKTVLLTGDAWSVAETVGRTIGVDEIHGELLPSEKVEAIDRLTGAGHVVAMVGDGVNDAPALVRAAVGVAMGSGTDVARESADVVLLGNDLSRFVETVRIARRARRIIRFNFVGTLAVDAAGVGLAAFGLLNPLVAAFIHVASEMTFILNSARLLPARRREKVAAPAGVR